jgi:GTPase SAR1 family protein
VQHQQPASDATSPNTDCYCVVYSIADRATFNSAVLTLSLLYRRLGSDVMTCWTACILVGNKSDLVRHREVEEDGKNVAEQLRIRN